MASGRGGKGIKFSLRNGPCSSNYMAQTNWTWYFSFSFFSFLFFKNEKAQGLRDGPGRTREVSVVGMQYVKFPNNKKNYFGEKHEYYKMVTVEFTNDISSSERDSVWQLVLFSKSVNLYLNRSLKRMEEESHSKHRKGYFKKNTANASTSVKIIFISSK